MNFKTFARINLQRAQRWHKGGLETWAVERWSNAFAGEAGEVCNAVKKLNRVQDSMQQAAGDTPAPLDEEQALAAVRKEIGDAYAYLDLLAQRIGTSVEDCARDAFNFISAREGFPERMPLRDPPQDAKAKTLEVRDEATFIPVLAVDINPSNPEQRYLMRRCGCPCDGRPNVILTALDGCGQATNDPCAWGGRTYPVAHNYIIEHWAELRDGDVVDVSFILGETDKPKVSERFREC